MFNLQWLTHVCATLIAIVLVGMGDPASANERYALVIANKAYAYTDVVEFADRDADAIETALRNAWGVKRRNIRRENNVTGNDLKFLFGTKTSEGSLPSLVGRRDSELIVYFAGHGSKFKGKPYLLGVDTRPTQLEITGYSLDLLLSRLAKFQRKHLPDGRVTVILESCFSGRSHVGELVAGTSGPAFGPPITISNRVREQQSKLLVMAAAQGDQYAVWDTEYRQSVFTDALVSGLHGEADKVEFGGDDNGKITLREMGRFISRRVGRRLKSVRPGTSQSPEIIGGRANDTLVETATISRSWREQYRRSRGEELKAGFILSNPSNATIESYLATCLYCPMRAELLTALDELDRQRVSCELEKPFVERLITSGTEREISYYNSTCTCCTRKLELKRRLASLQGTSKPEQMKVALATPVEEPDATQSVATKPTNRQLALTLQKELQRVRCYTGRIDGIWGGNSRAALRKFNKYASLSLDVDVASDPAIEAVKKRAGSVCPVVCGVRQEVRGGRCVAKTCGRDQKLNSRGSCIKVAKSRVRKTFNKPKQGNTTTSRPKKRPNCRDLCGGSLKQSFCTAWREGRCKW